MKKLFNIIGLIFITGILTACSGNKLDGNWVHYGDSDKYKEVLTISSKDEKITYKDYLNDKLENSTSHKIDIDEEESIITVLTANDNKMSYSVEKDVLQLDHEKYYREGSKQAEEAKEDAKKLRIKHEKQLAAQKAIQNKKKNAEKKRNNAIIEVEESLNKEFLSKVAGVLYQGKGLSNDASYANLEIAKYKIQDKNLEYQSIEIIKSNEERKVDQKDPVYYTFVGIALPKKHTYTDAKKGERSGIDNKYELPEKIEEIKELNTLEKFADYQRVNNVTKLEFEFSANGSSGESIYIDVNVNDLDNFYVPNGYYYDEDASKLSKEIPSGVKDEDFSI